MGRSRTRLLVCVLFGLLSTNLTFTIFNVALVDIAKNLGTTSSTLTWAITGPLLVVGASAPILGRLGDLHSHRRLYLFGLGGSLLCAILTAGAWSASALIGARLFSGLGAACLTASSWAVLFRVFPPAERTKVLGWWALVGAGGPKGRRRLGHYGVNTRRGRLRAHRVATACCGSESRARCPG